jgi:hypothetical protein
MRLTIIYFNDENISQCNLNQEGQLKLVMASLSSIVRAISNEVNLVVHPLSSKVVKS